MSDGNAVYIERPLTSAFKLIYIYVFGVAAWKVCNHFALNVKLIMEKIIKALDLAGLHLAGCDRWFLFFLPLILSIIIFLHLLRLYISIKKLEDPTEDYHDKYVRPLDNTLLKFIEHLVRIWCVFVLIINIKSDKLPLSQYLTILYFSLLVWDSTIYCLHRVKLKNSKFALKDTFFYMNAPCCIASITWYMFTNSQDSMIIPGIAILCIIYFTVRSLFFDDKKKLNVLGKGSFIISLCHIFQEIFSPYYGKQCPKE